MLSFHRIEELIAGYHPVQGQFSTESRLLPYLVTAFLLLIAFYAPGESKTKGAFPIANPKKWFEFTNWRRVLELDYSPREHFAKFSNEYPDTPYWVNSELGKILVLPANMINEIRRTPKMSSLEAIQTVQSGSLAGFEPVGEVVNEDLLTTVKRNLTPRKLGQMTSDISDEVAAGLQSVFSDCPDWKAFTIGDSMVRVVARATSRVFGGKIFARSEEWHQASATYTIHFLYANMTLRLVPEWSKSWLQWVLLPCILLRRDLEKCRQVIKPILEQRQAEKDAALAAGDTKVENAFDQAFDELRSRGIFKSDLATVHISLSMVAIHTTVDLLEKVLLNLVRYPELVEPLREEVVRILGTKGLNHAALDQLDLMDSVLKETQRLHPVANCFLNRTAIQDFELSNGLVIPKGTMIGVGPTHMWDDASYDNAQNFDGYRFLRMRNDPTKKHKASFVSTSPEHLGFGHGSNACPGRFFAANEAKILLSHFLLKYDWKFKEGDNPKVLHWGVICAVNPFTKLLFRRRHEEIDLEELAARD